MWTSLDYYFFQAFLSQDIIFMSFEVIVETEDSIRKMYKRTLFQYKNKKKLKRAPLI